MKYRLINDHRGQYGVMTMCRVLRASRAGFYQWLHHPQSARAIEDQRLLKLIRDSYAGSSGVYGSPRVFGDLREAGETCGKHRVARIMREHGLSDDDVEYDEVEAPLKTRRPTARTGLLGLSRHEPGQGSGG